jgi:hypothetical protein
MPIPALSLDWIVEYGGEIEGKGVHIFSFPFSDILINTPRLGGKIKIQEDKGGTIQA